MEEMVKVLTETHIELEAAAVLVRRVILLTQYPVLQVVEELVKQAQSQGLAFLTLEVEAAVFLIMELLPVRAVRVVVARVLLEHQAHQ
jgi:hypothetical protein